MSNIPGSRRGERGFTLLELMVVAAVSVPILGSVFATNMMVREEMQAGDTSASVAESCRTAGQRLSLYARSGLLSTCEVEATQADVNAAIAEQAIDPSVVVPNLGDWIAPAVGSTHPTFRFQAADGILSMNAAMLTPAREFEFVIDDNETANGIDDDGDGMVDEGRLQLQINTSQLELIATGVERCSFSLNGRILRVTLQCARRDHEGHVYRAVATHNICMRNS